MRRATKTDHGNFAETSHKTRSEAHSDAVAAAGDQAAADVHARACRSAEPGDGGEPAARGSAHRGTAARRTAAAGKTGSTARGREAGYLGRRRLRLLLRRLSRRRLSVPDPVGSQGTAADREHAVVG